MFQLLVAGAVSGVCRRALRIEKVANDAVIGILSVTKYGYNLSTIDAALSLPWRHRIICCAELARRRAWVWRAGALSLSRAIGGTAIRVKRKWLAVKRAGETNYAPVLTGFQRRDQ